MLVEAVRYALFLGGGVLREDLDAVLGFELPNEPRIPASSHISLSCFKDVDEEAESRFKDVKTHTKAH